MSVDHVSLFDPTRDTEIRKAVFGRANNVSRNPEQRAGLNASGSNQYGLVGFYRTEADSRPARPVLRPNDGPGDPKVRARLVEEARQRAERKRIVLDKPKTAAEIAREQREADKAKVLRFVAASDFGVDQRNMAECLALPYSLVAKLVVELSAMSLVETEMTGRVGRGQNITVTATEAGIEQAEAWSQ